MTSKQKSQLLGQWLEAMQNESDTEGVVGWSWGLSGVSLGSLGLRGLFLWLPKRAVGGQIPASFSALELRAAEMTVLLERQVAAQTHSPAVRQQFMASRCLWESWELPLRKTGAREGTKGRQPSPSSAGTPGQGLPACTAPCSAPSPRGRAAEAKSRGQEEFSPSGRV